jgi:hypothetical protein
MSNQLLLTEGFDRPAVAELNAALGPILNLEGMDFHFRRSGSPLEQVIQLIGSWQFWVAGLGIYATAFLAQLGKRNADSLIEVIGKLLRSKDLKPLADTAMALTSTAAADGSQASVVVGIDFPDGYAGTCLFIGKVSPEQAAYDIARFVALAEKIDAAIRGEATRGGRPIGNVFIKLTDSGATLEYMAYPDLERKSIEVSR